MRHLRHDMRDSVAPSVFWAQAATHACDVLNHATCPLGSTNSTYELATGLVPTVMDILPFGCRMYALIPKPLVGKTNPAKARSWIGINLGRRANMVKAYNVWIPTTATIVSTSKVYYNEHNTLKRREAHGDLTREVPGSRGAHGPREPPVRLTEAHT